MMDRRSFLRNLLSALVLSGGALGGFLRGGLSWAKDTEEPSGKLWGFGVDVDKCIGCARCVDACKQENGVPKEPFFFRTWVEKSEAKRS